MSRLLRKPLEVQNLDGPSKFQKFNLSENPFPSEPAVNKDSSDKRINGGIFEIEIRRKEYEQIVNSFLRSPQSNPNHLRLGYIIDTSYIGRGNGKSSFLVNLQKQINKDFCLDVSNELNKCFALYVTPEPGGRTKTFPVLVDLIFDAILRSKIIESCLATLRLDSMSKLSILGSIADEEDEGKLVSSLNTEKWFGDNGYDIGKINDEILKNDVLQKLPSVFPLFRGRNSFFKPFITKNDFKNYYFNELKRGKERLEFLFSHLVYFFQAASFNGAYILIDDFERIPEFQSARQKKDFAAEIRSCLFDGLYTNARVGFYNFILVLHAGVERTIQDAWVASGMENRAPISPKIDSGHIIPFEKLSKDHASLLIKKYLEEYRMNKVSDDMLFPFTECAIAKIGALAEYNATNILKMAYNLLDRASEISDSTVTIDAKFVSQNMSDQETDGYKSAPAIENAESTDLQKKANKID